MKVLVIFKSQLISSLLQDTFSMATGHLPTHTHLSFHISLLVLSLKPNFGPQERAQLSLHIHFWLVRMLRALSIWLPQVFSLLPL